jgi:hypothetical protein
LIYFVPVTYHTCNLFPIEEKIYGKRVAKVIVTAALIGSTA